MEGIPNIDTWEGLVDLPTTDDTFNRIFALSDPHSYDETGTTDYGSSMFLAGPYSTTVGSNSGIIGGLMDLGAGEGFTRFPSHAERQPSIETSDEGSEDCQSVRPPNIIAVVCITLFTTVQIIPEHYGKMPTRPSKYLDQYRHIQGQVAGSLYVLLQA